MRKRLWKSFLTGMCNTAKVPRNSKLGVPQYSLSKNLLGNIGRHWNEESAMSVKMIALSSKKTCRIMDSIIKVIDNGTAGGVPSLCGEAFGPFGHPEAPRGKNMRSTLMSGTPPGPPKRDHFRHLFVEGSSELHYRTHY